MGWAKYYEDNMEIIYERQVAIQSRKQETEIKTVCTNIIPITKIMVEIKTDPLALQQVKYKDRYIVCKDCGHKFLFSKKAQKHFDKMSWDDPKRCKCCRSHRSTRYLMCSSF